MKPVEFGASAGLTYTFDQQTVNCFGAMVQDVNPLHVNRTYAEQTPFGGPIVHGAFIEALVSSVLSTDLPGPGTIYESKETRFLLPVMVGETVRVVVGVLSIIELKRGRRRVTLGFAVVRRSDGKVACDGSVTVQVWPELISYSTLHPATRP